MTEDEIIAEAKRRGYTIRKWTGHHENPGWRVKRSKRETGADLWQNAANDRLWEIQQAKG